MTDRHVLYRMFDSGGTLLYVGITNNPKTRFANHSLAKDWWEEVANITVRTFSSREELAAAEYQAILNEAPRYNIACASPRIVEPCEPPPPVAPKAAEAQPPTKCPTCASPDPRKMPLDREELLTSTGEYIPFCSNPFHFPDLPRAAVVHQRVAELRKMKLLRPTAIAEARFERVRAAYETALAPLWCPSAVEEEAS